MFLLGISLCSIPYACPLPAALSSCCPAGISSCLRRTASVLIPAQCRADFASRQSTEIQNCLSRFSLRASWQRECAHPVRIHARVPGNRKAPTRDLHDHELTLAVPVFSSAEEQPPDHKPVGLLPIITFRCLLPSHGLPCLRQKRPVRGRWPHRSPSGMQQKGWCPHRAPSGRHHTSPS